ncbi:hypothetical protein F4820DRAFT_288678 [Hypoxylon rubiginosum]|uniref:Uncharacterized protein n=1 Tax=Hypoxylon rubiginosum TaxID=110542 RepID=A0ACB9ZF18_9PEZI|nr:hypothetical protein F4820DRAFT_288678 [Hypoxylon rubiginosum]
MSAADDESASSPPAYTPTHTTAAADPHHHRFPSRASTSATASFSIHGGVGTAPEAGGTYMIRDLDSGRALTLEGGQLSLKREAGTNGGWRWECAEDAEGWLGFREAVSYRYLGRDNRGGFCARAGKFAAWERFCLRPLKEGGFQLMGIQWWTFKRMGIAEGKGDGESLVEVGEAKDAARWEFVEV